ncbi:MAG: glycosyltransferase family 4 protein [Terrimicrobiaceae bacterium]
MPEKRRYLPLVVVAGQVPPPTGGQNIMIERIAAELSGDTRWRTVQLPFFFTPSFQSVRRVRAGKIVELFAVWLRFLKLIVREGIPDLLIYPSGGPQTVSVIRDILLLPLFCALSRAVLVQFHAAGIEERLSRRRGLIEWLLRESYRKVAGAIVMTGFNSRDPRALGIRKIEVIPHRICDENPEGILPDYAPFLSLPPPASALPFVILYAGHLYDMKGTPQLVEAFGVIAKEHPSTKLVLMGEFLPPYTAERCRARCRELEVEDRVMLTGVLQGHKKAAQFRAAHLFVFPSVAPYESFGLVMVEAMMWGLPVLATDWRGNRDVAGPDAAYCGASDPEVLSHLADSLAALLSDPQILPAMAATSRRRYESNFRQNPDPCDYRNLVARRLFP